MTEFSLKYLISLKPQTNVKSKSHLQDSASFQNPMHFPQSRSWLLPLSERSKESYFFLFYSRERKPLPGCQMNRRFLRNEQLTTFRRWISGVKVFRVNSCPRKGFGGQRSTWGCQDKTYKPYAALKAVPCLT